MYTNNPAQWPEAQAHWKFYPPPAAKVSTTTIDPSGKSVHSRNIIVEGAILPSQYYGTCSKR